MGSPKQPEPPPPPAASPVRQRGLEADEVVLGGVGEKKPTGKSSLIKPKGTVKRSVGVGL